MARASGRRAPGQVMIGDEHLDAALLRRRHAVDAGDAVVHGDDQVRLPPGGDGDDLRRQAVAVLEAVGHDVVDMLGAHQAQCPHRQGAAGGAVAVEVGHDHDAPLGAQALMEQLDRRIDALEGVNPGQAVQRALQLIRR